MLRILTKLLLGPGREHHDTGTCGLRGARHDCARFRCNMLLDDQMGIGAACTERGNTCDARTHPAVDHRAGPVAQFLIHPERCRRKIDVGRSEEHTSELQSLMRISYAVFCLKKK